MLGHSPVLCVSFTFVALQAKTDLLNIAVWLYRAGLRAESLNGHIEWVCESATQCVFSKLCEIYQGDLGIRKRPGTSCKIEIHFGFKITQYLINGIIFLSQICPRYSFPCVRHRHKVSNGFTKESGRDK